LKISCNYSPTHTYLQHINIKNTYTFKQHQTSTSTFFNLFCANLILNDTLQQPLLQSQPSTQHLQPYKTQSTNNLLSMQPYKATKQLLNAPTFNLTTQSTNFLQKHRPTPTELLLTTLEYILYSDTPCVVLAESVGIP